MPSVGKAQVHKPGAGDLIAGQLLTQRRHELTPDSLGDLSGRRTEHRRQQHRRVGGVITLPRSLGSLDPDVSGRAAAAASDRCRRSLDGGAKLEQRRAHGLGTASG